MNDNYLEQSKKLAQIARLIETNNLSLIDQAGKETLLEAVSTYASQMLDQHRKQRVRAIVDILFPDQSYQAIKPPHLHLGDWRSGVSTSWYRLEGSVLVVYCRAYEDDHDYELEEPLRLPAAWLDLDWAECKVAVEIWMTAENEKQAAIDRAAQAASYEGEIQRAEALLRSVGRL